MQRRSPRAIEIVEVRVGIQFVISPVIKNATMKLIGAAPRYDVDDCSCRLTVFGTVAVAQDFKLVNGLEGRVNQNSPVGADVVVVDTVDEEEVGSNAISVHREIGSAFKALFH